MGDRFREKAVEEGLEGDVAREAIVGRVQKLESGEKRRIGNRRRKHEEVETERMSEKEEKKVVEQETPVEEDVEIVEQPVDDEVEEGDDTPEVSGRGGHVAKGVAKVLGGDVLSDKLVLKQIPLLLLCLVYLLLVVANRYQVESLSRKKMVVQERVNELREQQIQLQKMNQNTVRISQIRDDLEREKGLGIMPTPPEVI